MLSEKIDDGLYRIRIPFEDLFTTVYLAVFPEGTAIIDAATYPRDVSDYVLPALKELGIARAAVRYLLLTHSHGDHAGGLNELRRAFPDATVAAYPSEGIPQARPLTDGEVLLGGLRVLHLPGHTAGAVGYLDLRTATLLSGDCLQLRGVGKYRNGIRFPQEYAESVNRLLAMDLRRIVAAHEYDPLGSRAEGRDGVVRYLRTCLSSL